MKLTTAILLLASSANGEGPTYEPGNFSDGTTLVDPITKGTLYLANGLKATAVGHTGEKVVLSDDSEAAEYHENCDGGASFPQPDGGHIYVSNAEIGSYPDNLIGAVHALTFDKDNKLVSYKKILENTAKNCHGGETPWGTWISCEETRDNGRCWQVDPTGVKDPARTMVTGQDIDGSNSGEFFGQWEAFAWDADSSPPRGYVTNDDYPNNPGFPDDASHSYQGAIVRFTPDAPALACLDATDDAGKWCALESGTVDYLHLTPDAAGTGGQFKWVTEKTEANPTLYAGSEGAHVEDGIFTFSTIKDRYLFRLDLEKGTYIRSAVPFPFEPDNLRMLGDTLYLCTDGDDQPGDAVWRWDDKGASRIFYEVGHSYPAGVDFTIDKMMMYVSMYGDTTYQVTRVDGLAFDADTKSIIYEVSGGIDDGKTHDEIAAEVNAVKVSDGEEQEDTTENPEDKPADTTADPKDEPADTTQDPKDETADTTADPKDEPADTTQDPKAMPDDTAEDPKVEDAGNGAGKNIAAGTVMSIITGTLML